MPSFAEALRRDIDRLKFEQAKQLAPSRKKPKKRDRKPASDLVKNRNIRLSIMIAGSKLRQLQITYRKETTGEVKTYRVAPYSYRYRNLKTGRRKMLFAYDMDDKHIKGFVLRNIRKAQVLDKKRFRPKWPVEIGGTEAFDITL